MGKRNDTPQWVEAFCAALAETGKIRHAADRAGISTGTVDSRRKSHPQFAERMGEILSRYAKVHAMAGAPGAGKVTGWKAEFLAKLAETSNVKASAEAAGKSAPVFYRLRRENPDFAARWRAALMEGYEHLQMETLRRLRHGVPADGPKFDITNALRLLAMHAQTVAHERARIANCDEAGVLASLNTKLDAMRRNEAELAAADASERNNKETADAP